jgi:hypothetical protein
MVARYSGSSHADARAAIIDPAPEISTTMRAVRFVTVRPYRHAGTVTDWNLT